MYLFVDTSQIYWINHEPRSGFLKETYSGMVEREMIISPYSVVNLGLPGEAPGVDISDIENGLALTETRCIPELTITMKYKISTFSVQH